MNTEIYATLVVHLKNIPLSGISIVEDEETPYKPKIGEEYLAARFLPTPVNTLPVGSGKNQYLGTFQVTVVAPKNQGTAFATSLADEVIDHFKRHTILDGDGVRVKINRQPSQAQVIPDGAWLRLPVSIVYQCMA